MKREGGYDPYYEEAIARQTIEIYSAQLKIEPGRASILKPLISAAAQRKQHAVASQIPVVCPDSLCGGDDENGTD